MVICFNCQEFPGSNSEHNIKAENHVAYFGYFEPVFRQDG